ncbi:aryl hydrocarbon receptor-like [Xyrauchen texanus]|uniref:aryl hydrocarbon receptor-like n=1 Tax=Xyrauchen texanus TaxID=154827 RepID=UPI0022422775|nr:aryl hydrocarbon receptor-like [Xyrauchen texanus]
MSGGIGIYAVKKRKKPVQKIPKPPPHDGIKSNPSKRHRDRLNSELDKLTKLLPFSEDIRTRLDKLSVLRLSVGYLKVKSFFNATIKKTGGGRWLNERSVTFGGNGQTATSLDGVSFSEGELLLQALNGFVLVVTAEGYVFYASPTIQDYLGFHQSDVVHQSVFELIHTDDRAMFRRQLHFALNPTSCDGDVSDAMQNSSDITRDMVNYNPQHIPPENSSFLERSFCCRFRCLLDNSSGFLALNFQGRLKYLHEQNKIAVDGTIAHNQLALFAIATPLQPPSILEIRSKTLLFQTKHKLDFTPLGVDTRGKVVLGYTEIELCMRGSGYQFIHAADMMYCADNHVRMIKTGESGLTVFRLLSKGGTWIWVQANARLVYKGGRPDFIVARQRALSNEEGEEHLRQRKFQLPFNCATGEGVLYEVGPTLDVTDIQTLSKSQTIVKPTSLDPESLLGCMLNQDHAVYNQKNDPSSQFTLDRAFQDSHALLNVPGNTWQQSPPNTGAEIKEEVDVKDMMETLQQIIGDSTLCSSLQELDVDNLELKEWENTLLRMNCNSEMDFNEIITNDILNYVEDALFKENCVQLPEQLKDQSPFVEVPECLPEMELQNTLAANQGFNCQPGNLLAGSPGHGGFIRMNIQEDASSPGRGMVKLTHMAPQIPVGQQMLPENTFIQSFGADQMPQKTTPNNNILFNPSLAVQCSPPQTHVRPGLQSQQQVLHGGVQENGMIPGQRKLQTGNQPLLNSMTLPLLLQGNATQPIGIPNENSFTQHQSISQNPQWVPDSNNMVNNLLDTCAHTVSVTQDATGLHLAPTAHLQGQFAVHTQNAAWPMSQSTPQQVPKSLSSGHQNMTGICSQITEFQRDPFGQLMTQTNAQGFGTGFLPQTTANNVYPQEGEMINSGPHHTTNSCMFVSAPQPMVNGMHYGSADPVSRQRATGLVTRSPTQASCYYQRGPSESVVGTSVIPQEDSNISPMACQIPLGLTPENILAQQYLSCNGQTQIASRPLEEKGTFHFPRWPTEPPIFSENNQSDCSEY